MRKYQFKKLFLFHLPSRVIDENENYCDLDDILFYGLLKVA